MRTRCERRRKTTPSSTSAAPDGAPRHRPTPARPPPHDKAPPRNTTTGLPKPGARDRVRERAAPAMRSPSEAWPRTGEPQLGKAKETLGMAGGRSSCADRAGHRRTRAATVTARRRYAALALRMPPHVSGAAAAKRFGPRWSPTVVEAPIGGSPPAGYRRAPWDTILSIPHVTPASL